MKFNLLAIPKIYSESDAERKRLRPIGRNTEAYRHMLDEIRQLVIKADDLGFYGFGTTEHHFHTEGVEAMPAPMVWYSGMAAVTKHIKFMPMSLVLPAGNPLRIAEEVALFDQMYPGRIEMGVARGYQSRWMQTIAQQENIASGPPVSDARNREIFDEHLEIIVKAWTEDSFSYNGKHFQVPFPHGGITNWPAVGISRQYGSPGEISDDGTVVKVGVVPAPATRPHPSIWTPFTLSPQTLMNAAAKGYNMLLNASRPEAVQDACQRYYRESREAGRDVKLGDGICPVRDIAIADSFDQAFDMAVRGVGESFFSYFQHFGFMEAWRTEADDPNKKPLMFDTVEELTQRMIDNKWVLCGTPDEIKDDIADLKRCHGDGDTEGDMEYMAWNMYGQGSLTTEECLRQIELFGTKVMPYFT